MRRHGWAWLGLGLFAFVAYDIIYSRYADHRGIAILAAVAIVIVGLCFLYRPKRDGRKDITREHGRGTTRRTDRD